MGGGNKCLLTVSGEYVGGAQFSKNGVTGAIRGAIARPPWLATKYSGEM